MLKRKSMILLLFTLTIIAGLYNGAHLFFWFKIPPPTRQVISRFLHAPILKERSDAIEINHRFADVYLPSSYTNKKKWPLVLSLHGYGSIGAENISYMNLFNKNLPNKRARDSDFLPPLVRNKVKKAGLIKTFNGKDFFKNFV